MRPVLVADSRRVIQFRQIAHRTPGKKTETGASHRNHQSIRNEDGSIRRLPLRSRTLEGGWAPNRNRKDHREAPKISSRRESNPYALRFCGASGFLRTADTCTAIQQTERNLRQP